MSDLISRQAVIDIIHKEIERTASFSEHETQINIEMAVKQLPTAYDMDKVKKKMEELLWECYTDNGQGYSTYKKKMKDIVRKGGVNAI